MSNRVIDFLRNTFQDRFRRYLIMSVVILGIVLVAVSQWGAGPNAAMPEKPPVIESLLVTAEHKYLKEATSGYLVGEGKEFRILCVAFHPEGFELSYAWEWDDGESEISEDGSMITWTAPYTRNVELTVTVTVSDIYGNMVSQSIVLEVRSCGSFG
jgi:hypothetical protein